MATVLLWGRAFGIVFRFKPNQTKRFDTSREQIVMGRSLMGTVAP